MPLADIDAIRARAALPPETTVITVAGWGDFVIRRLSVGESFAFQALVRENDSHIDQPQGAFLLTRAVVDPPLTDETLAILWPHPDMAAAIERLIDQIVKFCRLTPATAAEAVDDARAGFPVGDGSPQPPEGPRPVPVRAGEPVGVHGNGVERPLIVG